MYFWFCVFGTGAIPFCVLVQQCVFLVVCIRDKCNTIQCVFLVLCIRDRCNTILCRCTVYIAASNIWLCVFGTCAIVFESQYSVYCWFCVFGTGAITFCVLVQQCVFLVLCIRDRRNNILCLSTVCIAGFVHSGQVQYLSSLCTVYCCLQYITMQDWLCNNKNNFISRG